MLSDLMIATTTIIDGTSMLLLFVITGLFVYMLLKHFKGMQTPSFWVYFLFGFILISLHSALLTVSKVSQYQLYLHLLRLVGYLTIFIGIVRLFVSYESKIKFDRKVKK